MQGSTITGGTQIVEGVEIDRLFTITGLTMPTVDTLGTDAANRGFVSKKFDKTMEIMDEKFQDLTTLVELQNEKLRI
jgi:hypothetical protein